MGSETNSSSPSSAKRSRDPEDEVYVDNLHSHKRYLSEMMASSLNGLTVGDPLPDNLMDSPARSETMFYPRDEMSLQYSPMLEDSDDTPYSEKSTHSCSLQPESLPTSPISKTIFFIFFYVPSTSYPSTGCAVAGVACTQPRPRGSDSEGRFSSSSSDICRSADLRRAALLRSVQMRTQSSGPPPFELPSGPGQEPAHNLEAEECPCSFFKSIEDERDYQIEECFSMGIPS
ncbi:hypothetical protein RJ641_030587 [Dillenia turbinata]|uniref:Uncharacterized protein n=1 Tax=Dillenia turbinata TaxID=194707 RepID=A0AAN8ZKB9_9MAGN